VGLMYRVIDLPRVFDLLREHNFGGQTCVLKLTVNDGFLPDNAGSTLLGFGQGRVRLLDEGAHDVEVRIGIAEFSSLLTGTVRFESLWRYGLAEITDQDYVDVVNRLFSVEQKPMCTTQF
jgi:predicted acetyltransferase